MKKIIAAVIVIVFSLSFFLMWWNSFAHYSFDRDTGVLEIRGELSGEFFYRVKYGEEVKSIVASEDCIMPEYCNGLFDQTKYGMPNLELIDLSKADFSRVQSTRYVFYDCNSLKTVDLFGVDAPELTDMQGMYFGCNNLTFVDMTGFSAPKANNVMDMFKCCSILKTVDLGWIDINKDVQYRDIFVGCYEIEPKNPHSIKFQSLMKWKENHSTKK